MGGKNSAPPPPDYSGLIAVNEKTAKFAQKLAQEQFDWAKSVYNENKGLMKDTNTSFLKSMEMGRVAAEEDRARYKQLYQPMENRLLADARTYDTEERRTMEAGAAQANVAQQFGAARDQAASQLESFGVNPSATRFASLDLQARTAEAAAKAAAGTGAIRGVEDTARKLTAGAVDVGRGYPGTIIASAQQGVGAGAAAQQGTNQAFGTGAQAMGTGPQWLSGSNQALANWGDTLNNQYQNQLGQFNANQQSSSGFGSMLGMLGGMGLKMYGFEEGGVVPPDMSPSRGAVDDDVPAAVSVGEVIVPSDVVNWLGEKHFNKLAEKARKEKSETRAVPTDDTGVRQYAGGGVVEPPGFPDPIARTPGFPDPIARTPGFPDRHFATTPGFPDRHFATTPGFPDPIARTPGFPDRHFATTPGWPDIPGPGPMPGTPIRTPLPPPIPHYGPDPGRGIGVRLPPPIPHYGPDPGRGVRIPLPAPTPHPWQDPRGVGVRLPPPIPHYGPDPRGVSTPAPPVIPHPWQDPRGVRALIDPRLYPTQAVPTQTGRWAGR